MSKYTTQIRYICEYEAGLQESKGFNSIDEILKKAAPKIFNFDFPIFDEDYRLPLCIKILRRYYTREICEETVGLWKLRVQNKLCEIMPYYNQLYKSQLLSFEPFSDVNYKREYKLNKDNNTESNQNNENSTTAKSQDNNASFQLYSDTPQSSVENVENGTYLTNATKNTSDTTSTGESTGFSKSMFNESVTTTDEYIETITGKQNTESYSKRLIEYRETFLNIDKMILDELSDLFILLW